MEKKPFLLTMFFITLFLLIIFCFIVVNDFKKKGISKSDIHNVTNVSVFYTVEKCASKYVSYLMSKDYKVIYNLLDDNYIDKNGITEDTVSKYVESYDKYYGLEINAMYQYKDLNIYYIKGKLVDSGMDIINPEKKDFKVTVKLDDKNNKFSIIPDGDGGVLDD